MLWRLFSSTQVGFVRTMLLLTFTMPLSFILFPCIPPGRRKRDTPSSRVVFLAFMPSYACLECRLDWMLQRFGDVTCVVYKTTDFLLGHLLFLGSWGMQVVILWAVSWGEPHAAARNWDPEPKSLQGTESWQQLCVSKWMLQFRLSPEMPADPSNRPGARDAQLRCCWIFDPQNLLLSVSKFWGNLSCSNRYWIYPSNSRWQAFWKRHENVPWRLLFSLYLCATLFPPQGL